MPCPRPDLHDNVGISPAPDLCGYDIAGTCVKSIQCHYIATGEQHAQYQPYLDHGRNPRSCGDDVAMGAGCMGRLRNESRHIINVQCFILLGKCVFIGCRVCLYIWLGFRGFVPDPTGALPLYSSGDYVLRPPLCPPYLQTLTSLLYISIVAYIIRYACIVCVYLSYHHLGLQMSMIMIMMIIIIMTP